MLITDQRIQTFHRRHKVWNFIGKKFETSYWQWRIRKWFLICNKSSRGTRVPPYQQLFGAWRLDVWSGILHLRTEVLAQDKCVVSTLISENFDILEVRSTNKDRYTWKNEKHCCTIDATPWCKYCPRILLLDMFWFQSPFQNSFWTSHAFDARIVMLPRISFSWDYNLLIVV